MSVTAERVLQQMLGLRGWRQTERERGKVG